MQRFDTINRLDNPSEVARSSWGPRRQLASSLARSARSLVGAAGVLALMLPACVSGDEPDQPLLGTAAGSSLALELGVSSWRISADGDDARITGVDTDGARRAEVIVRRDAVSPDDQVQIEALFPESGSFEMARDGIIKGGVSDLLRRIGTAIHADLGERGAAFPATTDESVGVSVSGLQTQLLQAKGEIEMGWSLFGYRANVNLDGLCGQGTRDHYTAFAPNGASCWVNRWTTDSPYDCTINLHYGISGGRTDTCNWSVYTNL